MEDVSRIIIPPAKARGIVVQAERVYVCECSCRSREQACPADTWEVCLLFDGASPDYLQSARPVTRQEALSVLSAAAERGVIHQLFFTPRGLQELCSCCTCCCFPLRRAKREGTADDQLRSDTVAVTDERLCVGCGVCQESCFFEARRIQEGSLHFSREHCFGCGRCVDDCPEGAVSLEVQAGHGVSLSDQLPTGF